ncbi:MAG: hypothetical protein NTZ90_17315 [Proteobacteria bacterium]|nr:hypothetical protein [Pseudomonadota bacterium]
MDHMKRLAKVTWIAAIAAMASHCSTSKVQPYLPGAKEASSSSPTTTVTDGAISTAAIAIANGEHGSVDSVGAFDKTVHPLTVKWCGSCHDKAQSPLLGASDATAAHAAIISTQKVDFNAVDKSRLVLRLSTDKHNCPVDPGCGEAGKQMQAAIQTWADAIKTAATVNPVTITSDPLHLSDAKEQTVVGVNPDGVLAYFAPNFKVKAPMVATTDKTSGNPVINTPTTEKAVGNATNAAGDNSLGTASTTVNVATDGTYTMFGLVNGPAAAMASFYIKVDGGTLQPWLFKTNAAAFTWESVASTVGGEALTFNLTAGAHTIEIRQRQPGVQLARLVLTTNPKFDPSTAQATSRTANQLKFDLSGPSKIAGAALTLEIEDYAANGYLFRNPRLVVPTGSIHAKDLRILINNTFLPQNATFTVVEATVAAPGGALSTAAMIAVKDQGSDKDAFSVSFATFEAK